MYQFKLVFAYFVHVSSAFSDEINVSHACLVPQSAAYKLPLPAGLPLSTRNNNVKDGNTVGDYHVRLQAILAVDDLVDAVSE